MADRNEFVATEIRRIRSVYQRRDRELPSELYAPWQPASILSCCGRKQLAALMLHQAGIFPRRAEACLEVGYGSRGWLGDLITWGGRETKLHGMALKPTRARCAQESLPLADLGVVGA